MIDSAKDTLMARLDEGLDGGFTAEAWRDVLAALAARVDADDILYEAQRMAELGHVLRQSYDMAPVPGDLMANILAGVAAERASLERAPPEPGLITQFQAMLRRVANRSADALRGTGRPLSLDDLGLVAAGRGTPVPSAFVGVGEQEAGDGAWVPERLENDSPALIAKAVVEDGVVRLAPGSGAWLLDAGPETGLRTVIVDLPGVGAPAEGGWVLRLAQGRIVTTAEDHLELSPDAEGMILLADGSALGFRGVGAVRWRQGG